MNRNQVRAEDLVRQANLFHRQREYERAIAAYREAIVLMPNSPTYVAYNFMIGDMLAEMQRYKAAVLAFREAVKAIPLYDEAWFNLGKCLMMLEQNEEAIQAFDRCLEIIKSRSEEEIQPFYRLEINERTGQAWYYGALAHARLKRPDQARKYLEQALDLKPEWQQRAQQDPLLSKNLLSKR